MHLRDNLEECSRLSSISSNFSLVSIQHFD
jgi:hypothetical protein